MNALIFLATAVSTYYVMAIVQTLMHRVFGHRNRIRKIFVNHALGHHRHVHWNYAIVEFWIDRLTGTLEDAPALQD